MDGRQTLVLVDTNVWLDRYVPGRAGFETAKKLIDCSFERKVELLYPLRSIQDVFWQVQREGKHWIRENYGELTEQQARATCDRAWDCVNNMREIATAVGADGSDVWLACKYRNLHSDFEDDLVLAAAQRAKVDYLVTSDQQLIAKSTVAALSPEDMLAVLEARL